MQENQPPPPGQEKYPGEYVQSSVTPAPSHSSGPANLGERHPVNISECTDRFVLEMSVPGACASDLFIRVDAKGLLIGKDGGMGDESSGTRLCRHEFDTNPFRRYIPMPDGVDAERITASYANGILRLQLPKGATDGDCPVIQVPVY